MPNFVRARWALVACAALSCAAASAIEKDWQVDGGSARLSLNAEALASIGVELPNSVESGAFTAEPTFNIDGPTLKVNAVNGAPRTVKGALSTRGLYQMQLLLEPDGSSSLVGDFYIVFNGRIATFVDRGGVNRMFFELDPETMTTTLDEEARSLRISGDLRLSASMAHEVLKRPTLEGTVIGRFDAVTSVVPATREPAPEGGVAGGTANGPDVIVSSLASAFTEYNKVGTIMAYAMTTVSCNLGEAEAEWFAGSADHPVIVQNLYRLKGGRFEQIGMSWLKHGWCAADAPNCGSPYEANSSCNWLGTHATDTYGSSLNAAQSDLGPRSEINPWTGVYPYPYVKNWNLTGNAIFKRLQVEQDDLNPALNAGAVYYAESQYIATDEQAINRYNNNSYRRVSVSATINNGCYDITQNAAVVAQQPAINAWRAADAAVTIVSVDAPNDGRFFIGYKATDNGDGTWTYEYAVYNMNANAAAGAFSVPVPDSVTLTNIGFHDVFYHSGETYSGTDWPTTRSGGVLTWETDKFANNVNANALRWSTLYNFRFTANSAPTADTLTLKTWNPENPLTFASVRPVDACSPATLVSSPTGASVAEGGSLLLLSSFSGTAPIAYQWKLDGVDIPGATTPNYLIGAATPADAGSYTVAATNACGMATSNAAIVAVVVEPSCLKGDANCDGRIDNFDIDGFVVAILQPNEVAAPAEYVAAVPVNPTDCWTDRLCWGDLEIGASPSALTNFDIDPFVACVLRDAGIPPETPCDCTPTPCP